MADCSNSKNPLQRSGTSRSQQMLPALQPSSAPVMDKGAADWMVWAARLSPFIRYYDVSNQPAGTLEPFFAADIAARLTPVSTYNTDCLPRFFREQLNLLYQNDNAANEPLLKQTFTTLFDVVFSYLQLIDQTVMHAAQAEEFTFQLKNHIRQLLLSVATRAVGYHKAAQTENLISTGNAGTLRLFQRPIVAATEVLKTGLSNLWWQGKEAWSKTPPDPAKGWYDSIPADNTLFGTLAPTPAEKIRHAAHHNFLTGLLDEVSASAAFVTQQAQRALSKVLTDWPNHQPHYALFLAHLHLMEAAREQMNTLTARHLDFYYEDVLQLRRLPAQADQAFLAIELNKTAAKWAVGPAQVFLGGKDETGEPVLFRPMRETVLNQTVVSRLMAVYSADADDNLSGVDNVGRLFAAPVINSADGLGAALTSSLQEWHPFFNKTIDNGALKSINLPLAQVGFAVASQYLRLKEGRRTVRLRLAVQDSNVLNGLSVDAYLTGEKAWLPFSGTFTAGKFSDNTTSAAVLELTVAGDQPAVTGYSPDVHGHTFDTREPVLKILLPNSPSTTYAYPALSNLTLTQVELEVQVGEVSGVYKTDGIKSLEVHNDNGLLNPAKPFLPWGPEPTAGSSLIVGSDELFYKPGATVQLNFEWKDLPQGQLRYNFPLTDAVNAYPSSQVSLLQGGQWLPQPPSPVYLFNAGGSGTFPTATYKTTLPATPGGVFAKEESYTGFSASSVKGYLQFRLKSDFGHRAYRSALTYYLLKKAKNPDDSIPEPVPPYQPTLQSLYLSYQASCRSTLTDTAAFDNRPLQFLHLAPFGDAEQHAALRTDALTLLPPLTSPSTPVRAQGELYIGLENIRGGETATLLFQLMEGSENPLRDKPKQHVSWYYLSNNSWKLLPDGKLGDGTAQLIQSGILDVAIPTDATTTNTLLPAGLVWLKAKVTDAPDAVAKIIGIHANAVQVIRQPGKTPAAPMLPAGSINKLQMPDTAVKKIQQPYATFGGRTEEPSEEFYVRASERLRHKDRAITIWDCERLVLEAFPEIYKVKCLNHTKISGSAVDGTLDYNEVAPGHVTIITIPDLRQRNDTDPLKPYTRKSLLHRIETFLRARTSCHVRLSAAQPQFEEVRVACTVVLAAGYDDTLYYTETLQREVTQFLSPWAYGRAAEVEFGGRIQKSTLINFIEERPYVDYLTHVKLYHTPGETASESDDLEEALASTARSILVSAAPPRHDFVLITQLSVQPSPVVCQDE